MASRRPRAKLKRFLVQMTPAGLKELRAEQRRTGAASRAEVIRGLLRDGFVLRYGTSDDAAPASTSEN